MEAISIPCLPSEEEGDAFEKLEILYKLSCALGGRVYGRPNNLPISIFVLKELVTMGDTDFISEFKDLFDAVKEAAFALSDKNTAIKERRREELFTLFTYNEMNVWLEEKTRIIQCMGIHRETLRKIDNSERMFFGAYQKSKTTLPVSKEKRTHLEETILTTRGSLLRSEERIRARISELSARLKTSLVFSIESKIVKILMMLREVAKLNEKYITKVDPSVLSRRLVEVMSSTYKTPLVNADEFPRFSTALMNTQMEKSEYSALSRHAKINSGTRSSAPITHKDINRYVKSSGSLYIQNGSWTSYRRARRIKQKLVSKDAKRAFGWTRSNLLSPKRWVLYSLSHV